MNETIEQNVSCSESEFNLCVLGLTYNLAGCEPLRYMFHTAPYWKKTFLFKVCKKTPKSFPSLQIVGSEGSLQIFNTSIVHNIKSASYYKLHILVLIQTATRKKQNELYKTFCKNTNLKIVFSPFKLKDQFPSKDCLPVALSNLLCANLLVHNVNHWGTQMPFTIKDQGTSANWYKVSHSSATE